MDGHLIFKMVEPSIPWSYYSSSARNHASASASAQIRCRTNRPTGVDTAWTIYHRLFMLLHLLCYIRTYSLRK